MAGSFSELVPVLPFAPGPQVWGVELWAKNQEARAGLDLLSDPGQVLVSFGPQLPEWGWARWLLWGLSTD